MLSVTNADHFLSGGNRLGGSLECGRGRFGLCRGCGGGCLRFGFRAPTRDHGLPCAGMHIGKHAEHGGHGRLVVVHAGCAGGEMLRNGTHAEKKQRQRSDDSQDPRHDAHGLGQEHEQLNDQRSNDDADKHQAVVTNHHQKAGEL